MIYWIYVLLLFSPVTMQESPSSYLIVWNVGQGSWSTVLRGQDCWHFDAGGEKFPSDVTRLCKEKHNRLFISHDDWDHMSFLSRIKNWNQICLFEKPRKISSPRKEKIFANFFPCPRRSSEEVPVQELKWPVQGKDTNAFSRVYYMPLAKALFPGDSSAGEEKFWAAQLQGRSVRWWLLGHHGSRTSSSKILIDSLGKPSAGIASARYSKYHHPHPQTQARLKQSGIPLLRTEDWGHLWIQI